MKKIDRKVEWVLNMRIGTINMQGQPIAQIDRMRFQTQLKKELREIIIDKQDRKSTRLNSSHTS